MVLTLHVLTLHVLTLHVLALHVLALHVLTLHVLRLLVLTLHVLTLHLPAIEDVEHCGCLLVHVHPTTQHVANCVDVPREHLSEPSGLDRVWPQDLVCLVNHPVEARTVDAVHAYLVGPD